MILAALLGCGGPPPAPVSWAGPRETQLHRYSVELQFVPEKPPMDQLFQVKATLRYPDGQPVEDGKVVLDARMPQHMHGMQTQPIVDPGVCAAGTPPPPCRHPGGVYSASGFKFHMEGDWTITVAVDGPAGEDNASFVYPMAGG